MSSRNISLMSCEDAVPIIMCGKDARLVWARISDMATHGWDANSGTL